ncbi:MAG: hypothetical protein U0521_23965 [Anaerolineae bacterium]
MTKKITGIFNILATPFDAQQALDIAGGAGRVSDRQGRLRLTISGVLGKPPS